MEYVAGRVGTRHGFGAVTGIYQSAGTTTTALEMYAWYAPFSQLNNSVYGDEMLCWLLNSTGQPVYSNVKGGWVNNGTVQGATAVGATFLGVGMRLLAAYFTSAQRAIGQGAYTAFLTDGAGGISTQGGTFFAGPIAYVPGAPTEPSAGSVSAGVHRFGYLIEYYDGSTTRVSPDTSTGTTAPTLSSFAPVSFTAAGSKNLSWVLNPTAWPLASVACSIVMTAATNLNQYYIVPGSRKAVNPGGSLSVTFTIDISDADLASQATDATPYLYWYTQNPAGSGPISVRHIVLFGDRMAYLATVADNRGNTVDGLYVSERFNYSGITADQHLIQLPGQRPISTMFRMGSMCYVAGPHELNSTSDNNDVPVTWPVPRLVDGRHGTLAIHGVEVSPSGNYAWLADQGGLYVFSGGPITDLPVSYRQTSDWDLINWEAAYCVRIKDDAATKRVYVMVPLSGATTPSHIMTWDYTDGISADAVRYSLWSLSTYPLGAMELVRNDLGSQVSGDQKKIELWLGSTSANGFLRQLSNGATNPFRDNNLAITSTYRTCPFPGRAKGGGLIQMHHGFAARITGAGTIAPTVYDIDAARSFACRTLTLAAAPDADTLFLADLRSELGFVEFSTNTLDTHWAVAYLRWYYSPYLMQR